MQKPLIADRNAKDLNTAYGITEERRIELSVQMTALAAKAHSVVDLIDQIIDICADEGEVIYCVHTNAIWLYKTGRTTA